MNKVKFTTMAMIIGLHCGNMFFAMESILDKRDNHQLIVEDHHASSSDNEEEVVVQENKEGSGLATKALCVLGGIVIGGPAGYFASNAVYNSKSPKADE